MNGQWAVSSFARIRMTPEAEEDALALLERLVAAGWDGIELADLFPHGEDADAAGRAEHAIALLVDQGLARVQRMHRRPSWDYEAHRFSHRGSGAAPETDVLVVLPRGHELTAKEQ